MVNDVDDNFANSQSDVTLKSNSNCIAVEVVYGSQDRQICRALEVDQGTTAMVAVLKSGLLNDFPELEADALADVLKVGVYGRLVPSDMPLKVNDRVEIYRPLKIDPMQARRKRAKKR